MSSKDDRCFVGPGRDMGMRNHGETCGRMLLLRSCFKPEVCVLIQRQHGWLPPGWPGP